MNQYLNLESVYILKLRNRWRDIPTLPGALYCREPDEAVCDADDAVKVHAGRMLLSIVTVILSLRWSVFITSDLTLGPIVLMLFEVSLELSLLLVKTLSYLQYFGGWLAAQDTSGWRCSMKQLCRWFSSLSNSKIAICLSCFYNYGLD